MLNTAVIQGRFSADPELKQTPNGTSVVAFSLACQRENKGEGGTYQTDWINLTAWNGTAEFISRNFKKGDSAIVEGNIRQREWTDKDGNKRKAHEINVRSIHFCGKKTEAASGGVPVVYEGIENDPDLPF